MEHVSLERTTDTPSVIMDPSRRAIEIAGNSYPENAVEFYQPVYNWVKEYFASGEMSLTVILKLNYFNTSSAKAILNLLTLLQGFYTKGNRVDVHWYYDEDDEDMLETGKAFSVDFSMPFDIRSYTM
jgi:hypothetical protein